MLITGIILFCLGLLLTVVIFSKMLGHMSEWATSTLEMDVDEPEFGFDRMFKSHIKRMLPLGVAAMLQVVGIILCVFAIVQG